VKDWIEHLILRTITKNSKLSNKILSEIRLEHFISLPYKKAVRRILAYHSKKGRILSWRELTKDASLSTPTLNRLRAKEVKRKSLVANDASLKLPKNYDEAITYLDKLITYSKHKNLVNMYNSLGDMLSKEDITSEDAKGIISFTNTEIEKVNLLEPQRTQIESFTKQNTRKLWKRLLNSFKTFQVPTGFNTFDSRSMGIPKDSYWLIYATTGGGKSSVALQTALNVQNLGGRACLVSREMPFEENALRVVSNLTNTPKDEIKAHPELYKTKILKAVRKQFLNAEVSLFDLYVPDEESITIKQLLPKLKEYQYDIIFIDSINLMSPLHADSWQNFDYAGRYAKVWATNNKTVVAYTAQVDKEREEVRYGKALVEHAANAWKWVITEEELLEIGILDIKQTKARNQRPFPFKLKFDPATSVISDYIDENIESTTDPMLEGFDAIPEEDDI